MNKNTLSEFIGTSQARALAVCLRGEEREGFAGTLRDLAQRIETIPTTYQTDGQGDAATVWLHYFTGSADWYIVEKDRCAAQHQAFGYADLGFGFPEAGYISLREILRAGAELDLYWTPRTIGQLREEGRL